VRVFIAGGTGVIGTRLIPALVARGYEVTATTRTANKVEHLRRLGAAPVVLDGLDARAVGEAVGRAQPEAIIHQMTALGGRPDVRRFDRWFAVTNQLRTVATRHLLSAAKASGVARFVAQSFTGWPNARVGGPIKTEDDPLDDDPAPAQRESLAAIRFLEEAVTSAPPVGIALRYGALYGPHAFDAMVDLVRKRMMPIIGDGAGMTSWVHIDDAAMATVAALESGPRGIYNIVDDEPAAVCEWLPHLAAVVGARPPMRVPTWLGRLLAGEVAVRMMTEVRGSSNAKARRDFDWKPIWPTWRDGFRYGLDHSTGDPRQS
jgi:nucleoside-diphosphate-sugar epimerase